MSGRKPGYRPHSIKVAHYPIEAAGRTWHRGAPPEVADRWPPARGLTHLGVSSCILLRKRVSFF
jgi:hypothetical protein